MDKKGKIPKAKLGKKATRESTTCIVMFWSLNPEKLISFGVYQSMLLTS